MEKEEMIHMPIPIHPATIENLFFNGRLNREQYDKLHAGEVVVFNGGEIVMSVAMPLFDVKKSNNSHIPWLRK